MEQRKSENTDDTKQNYRRKGGVENGARKKAKDILKRFGRCRGRAAGLTAAAEDKGLQCHQRRLPRAKTENTPADGDPLKQWIKAAA
ncbi:E3 ubiquitin ligase PQT3-like [Trichinella pseudospiralis]